MVVQSRAGQWPLVGRETELSAFDSAWADRRMRGFVIGGPAGVGKTRIAEECLARVVQRGVKVARATASEAARAVPLGAVAHLIPATVDLSDPVKGFAAVASALASTDRQAKRALFVDDLHLLDTASTVLLRQLMDAGVIRLIATLRTGMPLSDAAKALTQGDSVRRVDLDVLDRLQVEELLRTTLGAPVGRRTLHDLFAASAGNVLYLRELVLGGLAGGTLTSNGEIWELDENRPAGTPRLIELISARLDATEPIAQTALELLALCGQLPLADLEAIAPLDALVSLETNGLIRTQQDGRRVRATLAHPLYEEVLRERLPGFRRRSILLRQAERTEAQGARRRDDALHIASWRLAATGTADPGLLVRAAFVARHAHDYHQVVTLLSALPESHRTTTVKMLQGEALREQGQWEEAESLLAEAEEQVENENDRVAVTISRTMNLFWIGGQTSKALEVVGAAERRVQSPHGRQLLRITEGVVRSFSGEPLEALALLDQELPAEADGMVDVNAWLWGAMGRTIGLVSAGRLSEAVAWGEHACETHLRVDEHALLSHPAASVAPLILALAESGRLMEARAVGQRAYDELIAARTSGPQVWLALNLARVELISGHPASARRWYAEAATVAGARKQIKPQHLALHGVAACAALLGDSTGAKEAVVRAENYPPVGWFAGEERLSEAWRLAAQGDEVSARSVLLDAAQRARETGHSTSEALLLTDVARLGGMDKVVDRLSELAAQCDSALARQRLDFAVALADEDADQLSLVSSDAKALGLDLLSAEAAAAAAAIWRREGNPRKAAAAAQQADASHVYCEGARTPLLSVSESAAVLTRREREVAMLAAAGNASRDIAEILHLSVRTVNNHLQHTYSKLGVSSRRELAAALDMAKGRSTSP